MSHYDGLALLDSLTFDRESRATAYPQHNELFVGFEKPKANPNTMFLFYKRCKGAPSGFGFRTVILSRECQGYGDNMQFVWHVVNSVFAPTPEADDTKRGGVFEGVPGYGAPTGPRSSHIRITK